MEHAHIGHRAEPWGAGSGLDCQGWTSGATTDPLGGLVQVTSILPPWSEDNRRTQLAVRRENPRMHCTQSTPNCTGLLPWPTLAQRGSRRPLSLRPRHGCLSARCNALGKTNP